MPKIVNDQNFTEEVINNKKPVLVDFWATWCMPCQMVAPIIDEIAQEMSNEIEVVKCNVDENPLLSSQFNIQAIPNLLLFKNGNPVKSIVGVQTKEIIKNTIKSALH